MHRSLLALVFAGAVLVPSSGWAASPPAPEGYVPTASARVSPGVTHTQLTLPGEQSINVAHLAPSADVELRPVQAFNTIAGGRLERTSSICERVGCLVAINGDFYGDGEPVGAIASGGELLRSQKGKHHLLMIGRDRAMNAGQLRWSGKLVATDLSEIAIDGVNVPRRANSLVLYTRAYASRTLQNKHGAELVLRFVKPDRRPRMDETVIVRLEKLRYGKGNTPIPADGAVLSGHGKDAEALRALWNRVRRGTAGRDALMRIDAKQPVAEAIGGSPILLRDGEVWVADSNRAFVRSRAPRTVIGWNDEGDVWLVTIDGRQAGRAKGMSLPEAARFLRALGATDAINLDGGGSTTFVVGGEVANRPSDRLVASAGAKAIVPTAPANAAARHVERPVANALVVVPRGRPLVAAQPPSLDVDVPAAETVPLPAPTSSDPASNPDAALPALLEPLAIIGPPASDGRGSVILLAALLNIGVLGLAWMRARDWTRGWLTGL